jgi:hypothetical protein
MKLTKYQKLAILRSIVDDIPQPDKAARRVAIQAEVVKLMTPAVRKVYRETPEALRTECVYDLHNGESWESRMIVRGNVDEKVIEELMKPYRAEDEERGEIIHKLRGVIDACTTLKKLKDTLPEFEKYFPKENEPVKNLPAVANLVTDMMKLGWPKKGEAK